MNKIGELIWITHKKYRRIVADKVPIAFVGIKFHGETPHIALCSGGPAFAGYVLKPNQAVVFFAYLRKNTGFRVFGNITGDRECSIGA